MKDDIRCQGVIIPDDQILLLRGDQKHKAASFWLLPGTHREAGESAGDCLVREMHEEAQREIRAARPLIEITLHFDGFSGGEKSYLCTPIGGSLKTWVETEDEAYEIAALRWFDLRDEWAWSTVLLQDPITYPQLDLIRPVLGCTALS